MFQFKSEDRRGVSQPLWVVNVGRDEAQKQMFFYLFAPRGRPVSHLQAIPLPVPARKWIHLEAFYRSATNERGRICVWQDGRKIFDVAGVTTSLGGRSGSDTHPIWGVGNYTDHVAGDPAGEGIATIYFDDAAVHSVGAALRDRP